MGKNKLYSDDRWNAYPNEWEAVDNSKPTAKSKEKHDKFMKKLQEVWQLDENGNEIKDKK